jgi:hypothetical protein
MGNTESSWQTEPAAPRKIVSLASRVEVISHAFNFLRAVTSLGVLEFKGA